MMRCEFSQKMKELLAVVIVVSLLATIVGVPLIAAYVSAYYEADAYNRVTGANVSTWDALFLELRVDGHPGKKGGDK
jgi:hypothetical protein